MHFVFGSFGRWGEPYYANDAVNSLGMLSAVVLNAVNSNLPVAGNSDCHTGFRRPENGSFA